MYSFTTSTFFWVGVRNGHVMSEVDLAHLLLVGLRGALLDEWVLLV
jgi:hypothetical protein